MKIIVRDGGRILGPVALEEVEALIARGEVSSDATWAFEGSEDWRPLSTLSQHSAPPELPPGLFPPSLPPLPTQPIQPPPRARPAPGSAALRAAMVVGVISWAVLLGAGVLHWRSGGEDGPGGGGGMGTGVLAVVTAMVSGVGLLLACVGWGPRVEGRGRRAVPPLFLNAVAFLAALVLGVLVIPQAVRNTAAKVQAAADGTTAGIEHASTPIPIRPGARTENDVDRQARPFYERNWLESYRSGGHRDPKWDADGQALIEYWVQERRRHPTNQVQFEAYKTAQQLVASGCDDPVLLYMAGRSQVELMTSTRLFEQSLDAFGKVKYPAVARFYTCIGMESNLSRLGRESELQALDLAMQEILVEMLGDGSFQKGEEARLAELFLPDGWAEGFFKRHGEAVCRTVASRTDIAPWVVDLLWGRLHVNQAWAARGNGYANTVTPEGWRAFSDGLAKARSRLTTAWKAQPSEPQAAAELLYVSMSESREDEMRLWFDRTVEAQLDYAPAYRTMLWALRPRWGGSYQAMLAFGKRCLDTRRFDTDVPWNYYEAVSGIASETDSDWWSGVYGEGTVYTNLTRMFDGYLASTADPAFQRSWRTTRAVISYVAERYDDARRDLEAIQWSPAQARLRGWKRDLALMHMEVAARTGPAANSVAFAERLREDGRVADALRNYHEAATQATNDQRTLDFIDRRVRPLELEVKLATGDWVDFLPPEGRRGWNWYQGEARRTNDGPLMVTSAARGHIGCSRARVGIDFEAEAEVELLSTSNGGWQAGIVFGWPDPEESAWYGLRIKTNATEGAVGSMSQAWSWSKETVPVRIEPVNRLRLRVAKGRMSAWINDTPILQDKPPGKGVRLPQLDSRVGLGAYGDDNQVSVRYRQFRVRRILDAPRKPQQE